MSAVRTLLGEVLADARTVAVLGCGSYLLGDDAAGVLVAERLSILSGNARAYCGGTAPENFTGEIKKFQPDTLLVIDAADMGLQPGAVALIPPDDIGGVSFSTHMLPLKIMIDYLRREVGCRIGLLGIQGVNLEFGADMTPEVEVAVAEVTYVLLDLLT